MTSNNDFNPDEFDFTGSQGATVSKEASKGGDFEREIEYLTLDASPSGVAQGKDSITVRFVTECEPKPNRPANSAWSLAWISAAQHNFVNTKHRPPYVKEGQKWPEKAAAGCRKDKIFRKRFDNQCYLCDVVKAKPSNGTWALCVEREQVLDDSGKAIGWRDKQREVFARDDKGEPIVERVEGDKKVYAKTFAPAWVLINKGYKNFFGPLSGQASYFGNTVLDRDFVIKRMGMKADDTSYTFIALPPITLPADNEWGLPAGMTYDMGAVLGEENGKPVTLAQALYPDMPDLRRIIANRVSDDFFGRYFIPGWLPEGFDPNAVQGGASGPTQNGVQAGYQPPQPQAPSTPQGGQEAPPADALAAFKARLSGGKAPAAQ